MRVGGWNSVISNSRLVFMPASLTVLLNTVPTPVGPSVVLAISWTRGLNFGSLVPSARKAKTSSTGRSTRAVPSKRPPAPAGPPRAAPPSPPRPTSPARHRGQDLDLGTVGHRGLESVEVADVLPA